jgi:hypothetical protein
MKNFKVTAARFTENGEYLMCWNYGYGHWVTSLLNNFHQFWYIFLEMKKKKKDGKELKITNSREPDMKRFNAATAVEKYEK